MYQYLNTPTSSSSSESYELPSWLSNYYSNKDAGLFGAEANKFYGGSPALAYSEQANQNPTSYSQVPLYLEDGGLEDYGFDEGPAGTTADYSLSDLSTDIETEVTDLATDIESEFSNISNEINSLSNYNMSNLSLTDFNTALNSTLGRGFTTALGFSKALGPLGMALDIGRGLSNAYSNVSLANMSRGMFGLQEMDFTDTVATGFGFNGFNFTDQERTDIASVHGTVGDVGAVGALGNFGVMSDPDWGQMDISEDDVSGEDEGAGTDVSDGTDGGSGGSGGGGGGSDTHICTAAFKAGISPKERFRQNKKYGIQMRREDPVLMRGYDIVGPWIAKKIGHTKLGNVLTKLYAKKASGEKLSTKQKVLDTVLNFTSRPAIKLVGRFS